MTGTSVLDGPPFKCAYCGQIWSDPANLPPCSHTDTEWADFQTSQGIATPPGAIRWLAAPEAAQQSGSSSAPASGSGETHALNADEYTVEPPAASGV